MNGRERRQAAELLREVLARLERGDITADSPVASGVVRRLEGVLIALDTQDKRDDAKNAPGTS